ncbi:MAG: hypothetical protein MET45_14600 [Nostoc sp. LLA-1]|nr:hypothetical protein [Cyanocohniella sp. LLY]
MAIPLNWNTEISDNGEIIWKASKGQGKPDLIVELVKDGTNSWNVNVFTDNQGNLRRKSQHCNKGLTLSDAQTHLETTFVALV